jgi:thiamine biosynthesis lipoprotein
MNDSAPPRPSLEPDTAARTALVRFTHEAMACTWELFIAATERSTAERAAEAAFEEVDRLEQELSRFIETSDVARINRLSAGGSLLLGADAVECLRIALEVREATNGTFDPTSTTRHWTPSGGRAGDSAPSARHAGSAETLRLEPATRRVSVSAPVHVDLGGVGKGYAMDQALPILRDWGVASALFTAGRSTVYAFGSPARDEPWRVHLRHPADPDRAVLTVALANAALSGSAASRQPGHIVDPRTGAPVANVASWSSAPSAALSDALSTAFLILPQEEIRTCLTRFPGTSGYLWRTSPEGGELVHLP